MRITVNMIHENYSKYDEIMRIASFIEIGQQAPSDLINDTPSKQEKPFCFVFSRKKVNQVYVILTLFLIFHCFNSYLR